MFSFDGKTKDYIKAVETINSHYGANRNVEPIQVKGRHGAVQGSIDINEKEFTIGFVIKANSREELRKIADDMVLWLSTEETKKLVLPEDPDRYYEAILTGPIDKESIVNFARVTVKFISFDGLGYSNKTFRNTAISDAVSVVNEGTSKTDFNVEATALEDSTMFLISKSDEDYFMIGKPEEVGKTNVKSPYIIKDDMANLQGWTTVQTGRVDDIVSGGTVTGKFSLGGLGTNFRIFDYGTPQTNNEWHGPAIRKSLSDTAQDFSAIGVAKLFDREKGVGKAFFHLQDETGKLVCSFGLLDGHDAYSNVRFVVRLYDDYGAPKQILDYKGESSYAYRDDFIYLKVVRKGKRFELSTWKYRKHDNGRTSVTSRYSTVWNDSRLQYQRPIRQVMLYGATHSRYSTLPVYFSKINIVKLKTEGENETAIAINQGDIINIDTKSNLVTINGEPKNDIKDFGSNYFKLDTGLNNLLIAPEGKFDTQITWNDSFL